MKCMRCSRPLNNNQTEWLEVKSQYKATKLILCPSCLDVFRKVFTLCLERKIN